MAANQSSGRDFAMLAAGIAAGIVGSRLLPPIVAVISGRARIGKDPFEHLTQEHREILSILDQMVEAPADSTMQRSRLFLMLKRKLAKHDMAEEDVVYPLLNAEPQQSGESKHLYDEHADMKILLFQLEELLQTGGDWRHEVSALRDLIRRHAQDEEQNVFPQLRIALAQNRLPKVSGQIRREESLIL